jgi:hypothetical protein
MSKIQITLTLEIEDVDFNDVTEANLFWDCLNTDEVSLISDLNDESIGNILSITNKTVLIG